MNYTERSRKAKEIGDGDARTELGSEVGDLRKGGIIGKANRKKKTCTLLHPNPKAWHCEALQIWALANLCQQSMPVSCLTTKRQYDCVQC